jgi:hypothetical protein
MLPCGSRSPGYSSIPQILLSRPSLVPIFAVPARVRGKCLFETRHWPQILLAIGHPMVYVHPYTIRYFRTHLFFGNSITSRSTASSRFAPARR